MARTTKHRPATPPVHAIEWEVWWKGRHVDTVTFGRPMPEARVRNSYPKGSLAHDVVFRPVSASSPRRANPEQFRYPVPAEQVGVPVQRFERENPGPKMFQRLRVTPRKRWMSEVSSAEEAIKVFHKEAKQLGQESFWVVPLDVKNVPLGFIEITRGILDAALVHPREAFAPAIEMGAASIMLFHNHPSGDPEPSPEDDGVTRRMKDAGSILGIEVLDHIVVGAKGHYSYAANGRL